MQTIEELIKHYAEVKKRINKGLKKKPEPKIEEPKVEEPKIEENKPIIPMSRVQKVMISIANKHGVSIKEMTGKSRLKKIVAARQEACFVMREKLNMSYPQIGMRLGGRDHTTAMHAVKKLKKEPAFLEAGQVDFRGPTEQTVCPAGNE